MSDGKYQPLNEATDDLPRTFRRERENRERAAREQAERTAWDRGNSLTQAPSGQQVAAQPSVYGGAEPVNPYDTPRPEGGDAGGTVTRFKVPFFSLMAFFIKAVFAAIPALLILIGMLYGLGLALQAYFPQLIKMKILISFPG
jgi:hypothetical protein